MKKKMFCIALISCLMLSLQGCKNAIPEMSEEQMVLVTEYAANLLLKYDANYQPMLLNDEELAAEEEIQKKIQEEAEKMAEEEAARKEAKEQQREQQEVQQQEVSAVSMEAFLELDQFSVSCRGIEFVDSYPDGGDELFFAVNASEGCRLAIVHLSVTNLSASENTIDIFSKDVRFKVSFNGGEYHNTMTTFIENDFSTYKGIVAAGETVDTVLMVDLREEECVEPEAVNLYMKYQGESVKTDIY